MVLFTFVSGSVLHHAIHVALQWEFLLNINSQATDGIRCAFITDLFLPLKLFFNECLPYVNANGSLPLGFIR